MTHSQFFANGTKLTSQNNYGVINQPQCDDHSFDNIVDQKPTAQSDLLLSYKSDECGIINKMQ